MKLWEVITAIRDMGGTIEDVRALMQTGVMQEERKEETAPETDEEQNVLVENSVDNVENADELEALRLENAQLKGQLQTYNILHASVHDTPIAPPADRAVEIGIDMIK